MVQHQPPTRRPRSEKKKNLEKNMRQDALSLVRLEGLFTLLDSHPADGLVTWTELMTFAAAARHGLASKDIETSMEAGLDGLVEAVLGW